MPFRGRRPAGGAAAVAGDANAAADDAIAAADAGPSKTQRKRKAGCDVGAEGAAAAAGGESASG